MAATEVLRRRGESAQARKQLDDAEHILEQFDTVETLVHAAFYRVNASYYQVREVQTM